MTEEPRPEEMSAGAALGILTGLLLIAFIIGMLVPLYGGLEPAQENLTQAQVTTDPPRSCPFDWLAPVAGIIVVTMFLGMGIVAVTRLQQSWEDRKDE